VVILIAGEMGKEPVPIWRRRFFSMSADPPKILVTGFALLILIGTGLLCLPYATQTGKPADFLTALFTSTSAVCVTGLVVVDTGAYWSFFGQCVIVTLIQFGGLGFMTMAVMFFLIMGKRIGLRERILIKESLNQIDVAGIVRLAKAILIFTFLLEGFFVLILSWRLYYDLGWPRCLWFGIFHTISAFNNAGIDLFGDFKSLTSYVGDPTIVFSITTLIILGGIGFHVIINLSQLRYRRLSVHSRLALFVTAVLIAAGFLFILLLEWNNTLSSLPMKDKLLAAYFQSVTRTAGYNTLDIGSLRSATQFLIIILMFIGASPGSTGGGIKTTTFGLLVMSVWSLAMGKEDTEIMRRRILPEQVYKAMAISLTSLGLVTIVTLVLSANEKADFLAILFETVSASSTVGLSTGITPHLTPLGKIIIIFTMYIGRLGPLALTFALAQNRKKSFIRYPEEKILIG
jgi:trk system potassium uptake protein TrkH